ncbi:efflux RND transporter periplasmic adaptor subunit [Inhella gelatinilytica]|uniref:Efflux RND transporter periplasmic adaptor subunit n=1 Tax=Inhella gelatinilytica TaxID=2795030 RepID=A0A931NAK5_9BURK|nr:efflux RND transporter periplasmic adaptor subunit [Inhella gelatinilytica]MBH9552573.1 efflux RND transporter periplasmic adaptor subunit [Inhella gelatinilytica]
MKRVVWALGAVVVVAGVWAQSSGPSAAPKAAGGGAGAGAGKAPPPAAVEVASVRRDDALEAAQAVGSLRAQQTTMLRPEVQGRIVKLAIKDGQKVSAGAVLVQLDDSVVRAQLQQAQAQAATAQSQVRRQEELQAQGFVSPSAVEQAQMAAQVAQAQVALAQAQVQRYQVRAPFAGVAGIRLVSVGDYVKEGADLVGLEDTRRFYADFRVAEQLAGRLKVGQPVQVTVDALPGQPLAALVEAVDTQADANGRALLVRARLTQTKAGLRTGLFVRVALELGRREAALWVPEEALVPQGGKLFVYRVVGAEAHRVPVKVGARKPGWVELLEGVQAGDQVVSAGQQRLRGDKAPIKPVDLQSLGSAPKAAAKASNGKP